MREREAMREKSAPGGGSWGRARQHASRKPPASCLFQDQGSDLKNTGAPSATPHPPTPASHCVVPKGPAADSVPPETPERLGLCVGIGQMASFSIALEVQCQVVKKQDTHSRTWVRTRRQIR